MTDRRSDGGFTLIELLVVMIVIGILAAIAIPVFLGQRNNAHDTAVKSDVANIGKSLVAYFIDGSSPVSLSGGGGTWSATDSGGATVLSGRLSQDNTAAGSGTNDLDWCVAVTSPRSGHTWWYTATAGVTAVDPGSC